MSDIDELISLIGETQQYFKQQAQRHVKTALTLRNWLFGFYITEYELNGSDRAEYGIRLFKEVTRRLENEGFKQIRERHLYLCKDFYLAYPNILRTVSAKYYIADFQSNEILRTVSAKLGEPDNVPPSSAKLEISKGVREKSITDSNLLINRLSFSHIIELLKADSQLKRDFYEIEALRSCWSVRELQRAMNSMLFERTGLSTNKQAVIDNEINQERLLPEDIFRNPYMLEFLGLKEEAEYSESDLKFA